MSQFTSKELYMMNGGNTLYIYKDGFGDIYNATAAEEAAWSRDVVDSALRSIDKETNPTNLRFAVNDLIFHGYGDVDQLLFAKMQAASPARKIVFAGLLWTMKGYEKSFAIIYQIFLCHRDQYLDEIFAALQDFKDNMSARNFVIDCLESDDKVIYNKACITISMWSYTGMPELRAAGLLDALKEKDTPGFPAAIAQLRQLLFL
ncbi:MAG: hypothetical protein DI535_00260 [Citrobacter freundii]|nr:MAG: hypothetical protein DI535_00260 [Citrobacter freundii]